MKKIICLLLALACFAALFAGCKANDPQKDPTEPASDAAPAEALDLEAVLKDLAKQYPDDTAEALASRLLENPYFRLFMLETTEFYYPALNESFNAEGVKEAACIWDAYGDSRAIVYVFTPETDADADAIGKAALDAVDPYWSEKPFDHRITLSAEGRVFFAMYNDGMEPITGDVAEKARDFVDMFHAYLKDRPDAAVTEIAQYLAAHQKITAMNTSAVEPGLLTGFGDFEHENEITGFAEGAVLAPLMSPSSFIGYVFRLDDGADVTAFKQELEEKANLGWNVCVVVNTKIIEADGNTVLFMMCDEK